MGIPKANPGFQWKVAVEEDIFVELSELSDVITGMAKIKVTFQEDIWHTERTMWLVKRWGLEIAAP